MPRVLTPHPDLLAVPPDVEDDRDEKDRYEDDRSSRTIARKLQAFRAV